MLLMEDLERLQLKLQVESAMQLDNEGLSKRLADLAVEASDAMDKVKALESYSAISVSPS